jgi:hypothetical protein
VVQVVVRSTEAAALRAHPADRLPRDELLASVAGPLVRTLLAPYDGPMDSPLITELRLARGQVLSPVVLRALRAVDKSA